MLNSVEPDQYRHSVGTDLGTSCLQRLSENEKKIAAGKGRVNVDSVFTFAHLAWRGKVAESPKKSGSTT